MSATFILSSHPDYNFLLRTAGHGAAARMRVVAMLRMHATLILEGAVARVPVEKESIVAAYLAKGIELVWLLSDDNDAVRFCATLPDYSPTPAETEAGNLLRACVAAKKLGDVPEFRGLEMAREFRDSQARRREGKPADDPYDDGRNARILAFYARLTKGGERDATTQTAKEFGLSARQIRRIINGRT